MVAVVTGVVLPAAAQVEPPGLMTKSFTVDVEPGEESALGIGCCRWGRRAKLGARTTITC
jgi:hypothetical protein